MTIVYSLELTLFDMYLLKQLAKITTKSNPGYLPNNAPMARPAVCGREKAAMALNTSGAPLPRAKNVTPYTPMALRRSTQYRRYNHRRFTPDLNYFIPITINITANTSEWYKCIYVRVKHIISSQPRPFKVFLTFQKYEWGKVIFCLTCTKLL